VKQYVGWNWSNTQYNQAWSAPTRIWIWEGGECRVTITGAWTIWRFWHLFTFVRATEETLMQFSSSMGHNENTSKIRKNLEISRNGQAVNGGEFQHNSVSHYDFHFENTRQINKQFVSTFTSKYTNSFYLLLNTIKPL